MLGSRRGHAAHALGTTDDGDGETGDDNDGDDVAGNGAAGVTTMDDERNGQRCDGI